MTDSTPANAIGKRPSLTGSSFPQQQQTSPPPSLPSSSSMVKKDDGATEEPEEELIPPENFALVCRGVYRSAFPKKKNFPFLKKLKLKSMM